MQPQQIERLQRDMSFQPEIEEEIPETKLSPQKQQEIYNSFLIASRRDPMQIRQLKTNEKIEQYQKDLDLTNRIDPQTRQIATYLATQIPDEESSLQMLQLLCKYGAPINFKDQMKQTIVFYTARDGKVRQLNFLIENGIDINEQDLYNQTPLFYAARDNRLDFVRRFFLYQFIINGRMIELNADVNHVDSLSSQTALFYAAREGHAEMCKLLMENGCKPNHQDSTRKTALFFAKKNHKKDVIDLITQFTNRSKEEQIKVIESESVAGAATKKKKEREVPKQVYKLIYTDDQGHQRELTNEDFEQFQIDYPDVARMLLNPDDMIDETMVAQVKEDENWEKVAKKIISQIWKAKGAYFFHQPVDPKKYGIDDYFEIVKKPMDFGTIRTKLNQNIYRSCNEFVSDTNQVFENCLMYNGTEHEVGKVGLAINAEFKQLVEQYNLYKYMKEI